MKNSMLLEVFGTLSDKERRAFRKFVASPYHNQQEKVAELYAFLEKADGKASWLEKEKVYDHLFPDEPFDYGKLRHHMSYLLKVLEAFLLQQEMEREPMQKHLLLCRALRRRGLEKHFSREWQKSHRFQQKQVFRNIGFHHYNYLLQQEAHTARHSNSRTEMANMEELSQELTTFYLAETLRMAAVALSHRTMSAQRQHIKMLERVLEYVEQNDYESVPAVALYFYAYRALSEPNKEWYFNKLKMLIERYWQQFPTQEIRDIYLLAINYSIYRMNRGDDAFTREGFELYKSGLTKEVLLENGYLSPYTYKNILIIALKLREYEWAKQYLEQYRTFLHPRQRENVYDYNLAHYYFRTQDYQQAMLLLRQVEFSDVLHNLDARRMLLRIYYELDEYDALESLLESFKTFIRRKKIAYQRDNYLNLIRFTRRLLMLPGYGKAAAEELRQAIVNEPQLAERQWLLKMVG